MIDTHCAFFSPEVFLQEGFPASLIHQASDGVIEEGSVGQDVVPFVGQSQRQVGFLSGRANEKQTLC